MSKELEIMEPSVKDGLVSEPKFLTGGQALMECFVAENVNTIFGYPGGAIHRRQTGLLPVPGRQRYLKADQTPPRHPYHWFQVSPDPVFQPAVPGKGAPDGDRFSQRLYL